MYVWVQVNHSYCTFDYSRGQILSTVTWVNVQNVKLLQIEHFNALRSLTQPLLDCILYLTLTQCPYDPGTLPSSANHCILGMCI